MTMLLGAGISLIIIGLMVHKRKNYGWFITIMNIVIAIVAFIMFLGQFIIGN